MPNYDLATALNQRGMSANTQRAYFRWIDRYLHDVAGLKATRGDERLNRMQSLPVKSLTKHLTPRKLENWLARLVESGQGRQALDQARATIVIVAELLAAAGEIEANTAAEIQAVSVPPIQRNQTLNRLLNSEEIKQLLIASRAMATTKEQLLRNDVVTTMLCTMALRREELSAARWSDLSRRDNGMIVLKMGSNGWVEIPRPVLKIIDSWRSQIGSPPPETSLIRRIWKGGRIANAGLSPDGIWLIIRSAAEAADLGHVTPDDLRRSAVANMVRNRVPLEEISRILRHRNILITERFIAKLAIEDPTPPETE
ncbi:MAG: site-specific integrase [Anaerolineae bacterium]|nr:site-specific integrase [Anaerolineae bacterium]